MRAVDEKEEINLLWPNRSLIFNKMVLCACQYYMCTLYGECHCHYSGFGKNTPCCVCMYFAPWSIARTQNRSLHYVRLDPSTQL